MCYVLECTQAGWRKESTERHQLSSVFWIGQKCVALWRMIILSYSLLQQWICANNVSVSESSVHFPPPDSGLGFWLTDMKSAGFWYWIAVWRNNASIFSCFKWQGFSFIMDACKGWYGLTVVHTNTCLIVTVCSGYKIKNYFFLQLFNWYFYENIKGSSSVRGEVMLYKVLG